MLLVRLTADSYEPELLLKWTGNIDQLKQNEVVYYTFSDIMQLRDDKFADNYAYNTHNHKLYFVENYGDSIHTTIIPVGWYMAVTDAGLLDSPTYSPTGFKLQFTKDLTKYYDNSNMFLIVHMTDRHGDMFDDESYYVRGLERVMKVVHHLNYKAHQINIAPNNLLNDVTQYYEFHAIKPYSSLVRQSKTSVKNA